MRDFLTLLGLYSRPRQECRRPNPVSSAAGTAEPQSCTLAVTLAAQPSLPEPHSSPINPFCPENYPFPRTKHQKNTFPFGKTTHFPDKHSYFGYRFMQIWSCTPNLHKMDGGDIITHPQASRSPKPLYRLPGKDSLRHP